MEPNLNPEQIALLSVLAGGFTFGLKMLLVYFKVNPPRSYVAWLLFAISAALSFAWTGFQMPAFGVCNDPLTCTQSAMLFLAAILTAAAPVLTLAYLIYTTLYDKVFSKVKANVIAASNRRNRK